MRLAITILASAIFMAAGNAPAPKPVAKEAVHERADVKKAVAANKFTHIVDKAGKGSPAKAGQQVTVHYTGWLPNGTKFDSSVDRNQPFKFALGAGQVIKGWDQGVAGMLPGEQRILVIPPDMGYGARGAGGVIPPNSTLIFAVELISAG